MLTIIASLTLCAYHLPPEVTSALIFECLFCLHILLHTIRMKCTNIYNAFLEYNHVSATHFYELCIDIHLIIQNLFDLETFPPAWCLINAEIVDIILQHMMICASWYVSNSHTCWAKTGLGAQEQIIIPGSSPLIQYPDTKIPQM